MSIIRYNPSDFTPISFSNLVDKFFNDSLVRAGSGSFIPRADIVENEKGFELHVEVPGMNKEDFKIELKDNYLVISGERKFKEEKNEEHFQSIETRYGAFSRSFAVPENVEASKISAKYNNGILEVTLPKDEKKALKATIKVG